MTFREFFRNEHYFYDENNNRVSYRETPDGTEYKVIKNFPDEAELGETLSGYGQVLAYHHFPDFERWMIIVQK